MSGEKILIVDDRRDHLLFLANKAACDSPIILTTVYGSEQTAGKDPDRSSPRGVRSEAAPDRPSL